MKNVEVNAQQNIIICCYADNMCFQLVFPVKVQNILMWEKLTKLLDHVKKFGTLSKKTLSLVTSTFFAWLLKENYLNTNATS